MDDASCTSPLVYASFSTSPGLSGLASFSTAATGRALGSAGFMSSWRGSFT